MKKIIPLYNFLFGLTLLAAILSVNPVYAQVNKDASYALIKRVIPLHAASFAIEQLHTDGKDAFEIESRSGKIILRGNNSGDMIEEHRVRYIVK